MTEPLSSPMARERLFVSDGEMGALMRSHNWSQTPLGSVEQWSQSLYTTINILLSSHFPMCIVWGSDLVMLYNDAYRSILGRTKHPDALGNCAPEIWAETWVEIAPLVNQALTNGEATWRDDFLLLMDRNGYTEETYFTFSYSPIWDETGGIGGLLGTCAETTQQVLGERRLRTLRDLAAQTAQRKTVETACQSVMQTLANNPADIPFALLYLLDADGIQAKLVGITGLDLDTLASPQAIALAKLTEHLSWSLATVAQTAQLERIENLAARFGALKAGPWEESPHTALVIPVILPGQKRPTGILVAGISARRALDDAYQGFLELVAVQVASAIADARTYIAECRQPEFTIREHELTECRQAEIVLQQSQQQLQTQLAEIEAIYQSAPIGLSVLDTNLRFVRINQRLAEINGLSIDAHIGRTVREVLPKLADATEQLLRLILETGEPLLNVEITGETPAQPGVQRTWVEHFFPLKDGDRVIGINTVCEEITDRKRLETERNRTEADLRQAKEELEIRVTERMAELRQINAELQQSESILRSFFNSGGMLMAIVELHHADIQYVSANHAMAEFLGTTPEVLQQRFGSDITGVQAELQPLLKYYQEAQLSQAPVRFEYCYDQGNSRWLFISICPIMVSPNGHPKFSFIAKDVTDRKQAEAALAQHEEQLRLTLEFTHIGTWDWEVKTGDVIWNDNHFRLLGLEPESTSAHYQRWLNAIYPDDVEQVEQTLLNALTQHIDYEAEYRVFYPDGTLHWLTGKGRGMYDDAGEPIRMLGVILDVSDRKQAEENLAASLKEKEVLLKEIHHRVKNNLGIVSGLLQMQSRRTQDPHANTILQDSQNRIASIALVHEKLYRSEDFANIDLAQYLQDLTIYLFDSYKIGSNQITLDVQVEPVNLEIETAIPCGLIVNELVSNALKHAFPGNRTGNIQVRLEQSSTSVGEGKHQYALILIVRDNGIGFPHNFDPKTTTTLGISLVQGLVAQIRGVIEVNCQQGTEVKITFSGSTI